MNTRNTNTIYLIRHGENPANLTKEFSYKRVDYSLTPKGILQAIQTAAYFRGIDIHEIYSSPLKRAQETAGIIAEEARLPVTVMEIFREINVGDLELRPPTAENWAIHNQILIDWFQGRPDSTFPDGENLHMAVERMRAGVLEITRQKNGKNIVIVGHGGIFAVGVWKLCTNVNPVDLIRTENHNCSITEVAFTTTDHDVQGILKGWAACAHLSGEAAQLVSMLPET